MHAKLPGGLEARPGAALRAREVSTSRTPQPILTSHCQINWHPNHRRKATLKTQSTASLLWQGWPQCQLE